MCVNLSSRLTQTFLSFCFKVIMKVSELLVICLLGALHANPPPEEMRLGSQG